MVSILHELIYPFKKLLRMGIKELREKYDVDGLEEVIEEIENLKKLGYYEKLYNAFKLRSKVVAPGVITTKEERKSVPLIRLASHNLSNPLLYLPPITDLIYFKMFYVMYTYLEYVYYLYLGKKLENEDKRNVYFTGLDERLVFGLDKFDEVFNVPEPTAEFFLKLKNVKWKDKGSKKFSEILNDIIQYAARDISLSYIKFTATEYSFLVFLSGCSAVNDGRDKIIEEDVIRSFKTYFKLMKTDITKLVDKGVKHYKPKVYEGYLVCHDCGGYYQLQPGESPDDFSDTCECGGELKYYEDIDWLLDKKEDSKSEEVINKGI